jgi:hypothetical protein
MTVYTITPAVPARENIEYDLNRHGAVLIIKARNSVGQFNYTTRPLSPSFVQFILFWERFFQ